MPRTIRVKLTPTPVPVGSGAPARVKGLLVTLLDLGKGTTAGGQAPKPCTLTFHFGFREKLRDGSAPTVQKLATLEGTLELGKNGPVFVAAQTGEAAQPLSYDPGADVGDPTRGEPRLAEPVDETPPPESFPRFLELSFDTATFRQMADAEGQNLRLLVPAEPEGVRHLELFADLTLGGANEAPLDTNDVLDVFLTKDNPPRNEGLRLILSSDDDVLLPEVEFSIAFENGVTLDGKLNRDGMARVLDAPRGFFEISYGDFDDMRAKVMAGRARQAIAKRDVAVVLGVLGQSSTLLAKVSEAYDTYFNDLGGQGLVADARSLTKGSDSEPWAEHLIATAQLQGAKPTELFAMNEPVVDPSLEPAADGGGSVVV
jgi:hypothetical protein